MHYSVISNKLGEKIQILTKDNMYIIRHHDSFIEVVNRDLNSGETDSIIVSGNKNYFVKDMLIEFSTNFSFEHLKHEIEMKFMKELDNFSQEKIFMSNIQMIFLSMEFKELAMDDCNRFLRKDPEIINKFNRLYDGVFNYDLASLNELIQTEPFKKRLKAMGMEYPSLSQVFTGKPFKDGSDGYLKYISSDMNTDKIALECLKENNLMNKFSLEFPFEQNVTLNHMQKLNPDIYTVSNEAGNIVLASDGIFIYSKNEKEFNKVKCSEDNKFKLNGIEYPATADGLKLAEIINFDSDYKFSGDIDKVVSIKEKQEVKAINKIKNNI